MYYSVVKKISQFLILFLVSCKINPTYSVTGVVLEKDKLNRIMLIDHDEIKGFMDPMIMNFKIHDSVLLDKINLLDSVKFDLVILEGGHHSINFKILGQRNKQKNEDFLFEEDEIYREKQTGEIIDNISLTQTNNEIFELHQSEADYNIISYIFSRCPMPEMCPAVITKNIYLANTFKDYNIDFLLISFDFKYDTPYVLQEKYKNIEENHKRIKFLSSTNHYNDLILLTKQSGISFGGVEENNIGHTMKTLIIDKNNKVIKSYSGLDWKPSDLKKFLTNYIDLLNK